MGVVWGGYTSKRNVCGFITTRGEWKRNLVGLTSDVKDVNKTMFSSCFE